MRLLLWLGVLAAGPAALLAQQKNFVACPIVRDTKTRPCYLAAYDGETYFLGTQEGAASDFHAPELKHQVLVEGTVVEGPRVCGGIPLKPVSISVFKEIALACNTLLPAEPGIEAPPPTGVLSPTLSTPGNRSILYAFNDDQLDPAGVRVVTELADYAKRIHAGAVKVSGYRATSVLSNGERLAEKPGIAEQRAQNVATILRGLGVSNVSVEWKADAEPGDGISDPSRRRVTVAIAEP